LQYPRPLAPLKGREARRPPYLTGGTARTKLAQSRIIHAIARSLVAGAFVAH
jgi:hypothetical protein